MECILLIRGLDAAVTIHRRFRFLMMLAHITLPSAQGEREQRRKLPIFLDEYRVCPEKIVMYAADVWVYAANT